MPSRVRHLIRLVSIFFVAALSNTVAFSQSLSVISVPGIAESNVQTVVQDKYGFIWMGTTSGLFRYDAASFLTINQKSQPALQSNDIKSLLVKGDSLWIAHHASVEILDLKTFTVSSFPMAMAENDFIIKMREGLNGDVWLASSFGYLYRQTKSGLTMVQEPTPTYDWLKATYNHVIAMGVTQGGFWWSRLDGNLFLHRENSTRQIFSGDSLQSKGLTLLTDDGTLWHASNHYFFGRTSSGKRLAYSEKDRPDFPLGGRASCYVVGQQNEVWMGSFLGNVVKVHSDNHSKLISRQSLPAPINDMFVDAQGLLWVATSNGLFQLQSNPVVLQPLLSASETKISMRKILQDEKGDTYLASYAGLFYLPEGEWGNPKRIALAMNETPIVIYDMVNDPSGFLWMACEGHGLLRFDKKTRELTSINKYNNKGFAQRYFVSLMRDANGLFWIGSYEGLLHYAPHERKFSLFKNDRGDSLFYNQMISDVEEDQNGNIWVGAEKGLYKINRITKAVEKIAWKNKISEATAVRSLFFDSRNVLWVGTKDEGLISYDLATDKVHVLTEADGLANNSVYEILEEPKKGILWITTKNGLSRLEVENNLFRNFSITDGLPSAEFNLKSACVTHDNKLLLGGLNGVAVVDPLAVTNNEINTPLRLISYGKYDAQRDTLVLTSSHQETSPIQLAYNDRMFSIQFRLLNFELPIENKYAYKIEGQIDDWVYIGTQNNLLLGNLEPGSHTISIKGAGRDGRWSSAILEIPVEVQQAFYKTWWFIAGCFACLVALGYLLHRYRVQQVLVVERMRTRIARDLHDELGTSLTSIGIYSDLAREQTDADQKYIDQIAGLSREASTTLRDIVWAIDSKDDTLESVLLRLRELMHQMLEVKGIQCDVLKFNLNEKRILPAFVKQNVYLIFKEGINNIARHASANRVELKIEMDHDSLRMELINDGIVRDAHPNPQGGNGLRNIKSRTEAIGGSVQITSEEVFSICLTLPLSMLHAK